MDKIKEMLSRFPKTRKELPEEYKRAFDDYYEKNRNANTTVTKASSQMEGWMHKKIAKTTIYINDYGTLEIGGGTLNQLGYEEKIKRYDVVEPNEEWINNSEYRDMIDDLYSDIRDVPEGKLYDRITSCACFEHILDLPYVIAKSVTHLTDEGVLSIGIPNEGRFLWRFGYLNTTGREFKKKYGLNYEICMKHEHVNTADEIEELLRYFFDDINVKLYGIGKELSFYRYIECKKPNKERAKQFIAEYS